MERVLHHFGRAHLGIFLGLYLVFAGLTALALAQQTGSDRQQNANLAATVGSIAGPFTGAIARNLQSCCWQFSLQILPWSAASLVAGVVFQFLPLPLGRADRSVRLLAWGLGLLGWFGGGVVSFAHALS